MTSDEIIKELEKLAVFFKLQQPDTSTANRFQLKIFEAKKHAFQIAEIELREIIGNIKHSLREKK